MVSEGSTEANLPTNQRTPTHSITKAVSCQNSASYASVASKWSQSRLIKTTGDKYLTNSVDILIALSPLSRI